jgi:glutamate carboxypeptidase
VLIAGHLDTVFAPPPAGTFTTMTVAPDGKTAVGPGVVDMKGGLLTTIAALEALEASGVDASWTFMLNSDEETGTYHSERALRAEAARHDVGLAMEPALPGGELAIERFGAGQFMLEAHGRSAHVGRDFASGVSATGALARAIVDAAKLVDLQRGRIVNIGPLKGGEATNVVPDYAAAWGNVRFPSPEIADELARGLDALACGAEGEVPRVVVRRSFNRPAKPLTSGTRRLADLARDAAESLGQRLPFASTGGVCDGNILQDAGLPTIDTLGVRGGGLHTTGEWIDLSSLVERAALFAVVMIRIGEGRLAP